MILPHFFHPPLSGRLKLGSPLCFSCTCFIQAYMYFVIPRFFFRTLIFFPSSTSWIEKSKAGLRQDHASLEPLWNPCGRTFHAFLYVREVLLSLLERLTERVDLHSQGRIAISRSLVAGLHLRSLLILCLSVYSLLGGHGSVVNGLR